jgi:hypothetical protein
MQSNDLRRPTELRHLGRKALRRARPSPAPLNKRPFINTVEGAGGKRREKLVKKTAGNRRRTREGTESPAIKRKAVEKIKKEGRK